LYFHVKFLNFFIIFFLGFSRRSTFNNHNY